MKNIIKLSILSAIGCFAAATANAQLSSEKPAMTADQAKQIITRPAATDKKSTVVTTTDNNLKAGAVKIDAKTPVVSDQGGVKPEEKTASTASSEPVKTEVKLPEVKIPVVSMQEEKKPDEKKKVD